LTKKDTDGKKISSIISSLTIPFQQPLKNITKLKEFHYANHNKSSKNGPISGILAGKTRTSLTYSNTKTSRKLSAQTTHYGSSFPTTHNIMTNSHALASTN